MFLEEQGPAPLGKIADACGCSVRCVQLAIAAIKRLGLLSGKKTKSISHDHADHGSQKEGTAQSVAEEDCATATDEHQADGDRPVDPLRSSLEAYEILPWCVEQILAKIELGELLRTNVEQQLAFHQFRLDNGFRFKAHPAKFLFSAILRQFAPPEGYFATAHKKHEGISSEPKPIYRAPAPRQEPVEPASLEDKAATIRTMLASPLASVRRLGTRLAADWGVSIPSASGQEAV